MDSNHKLEFGKHTGTPLLDIPDQWFDWITHQPWFIKSTEPYHTELKEYIKTRKKKDKGISMNMYPAKNGWDIIFDCWYKSGDNDLLEYLKMYFDVPLPKK